MSRSRGRDVAVLVTRPEGQAGELARRLRALGVEPIEAPTIVIRPLADRRRLEGALSAARDGAYDWVAFTSPNGVAAAAAALPVGGARTAAVGPTTAEALARTGSPPDLVADPPTAAALAGALEAMAVPGRLLLPRGDRATPLLPARLRAAGWHVDEVVAYHTVPAGDLPLGVRERVDAGGVDVITFASSSAVRAFLALLGHPPPTDVGIASIGPVTSRTCAELGLTVDAEADPHDLDGLVEAVRRLAGYPRAV